MTLTKSLVATLIGSSLCLPAVAQDFDQFSRPVYIGIAGGSSNLEPESQVSQFFVEDDSDVGTKIFLGWDFLPRFGAELAFATLGSANIGPNSIGTIDYDVYELSGIYHFFNLGGYDATFDRRGLGAFVKLGVGVLDNDSPEGIPFTRENDFHLSGGIGIEYGFRFGLAIRAEIEAFDEDAMLSSVGALWRFGSNSNSDGGSDDGLFSNGSGAVGGLLGGGDDLPTMTDDDDEDGVPNSLDDCMDTAPGVPVTATGCAIFGGVLEGVVFESGSDRLVGKAQSLLNDAADVLLNDPSLNVEVRAHTDSQGSEDFNLELSKKRALATVRYLMLRGVPAEQLTARAFGEAKPVADNSTPEGRETNRRVEFHVIDR